MDQPLISVIVTTYNYAHTVGTAIDSALAQDYPNLEVVVVDNASTDDTAGLMERYRDERRLRYVRNAENIGMVPNHNKGLDEARGDYLLFLSADDFLMPGHLTLSYAYLIAHPEIDVLYTAAYFVDENEHFIGVRQMGGQPLIPYAGGRHELAGLFIEGCYMCFPTMLMKRDLYERFGRLDEDIKAADYEIVMRWAANGVRFAYLPEPTCAVRLHTNQQSSAQNYLADAGDIREFAYLVNKFVPPFGEQLAGFEMSISRHMWARYRMAFDAGVTDGDGAIRALLLAADQQLAAAKTRNAASPAPLRPTVILIGSQQIVEMERTFRSLVAQTYVDWDAIVVEHLSHTFAELAAYVDSRQRIHSYRPVGPLSESTAINTAIRIASGNVFVIVRAGNELAPGHIGGVIDAIAANGLAGVRTAARLHVDGAGPGAIYDVFGSPADVRMPWTAPFGPVETFAFTRAAIDETTAFNERLPGFAEWEFFLRVALAMPVGAIDTTVTIHATAGGTDPYARFASLPPVANAIYEAFRTDDPDVASSRSAFVQRLQSVLSAGPAACSTPDGLVRLHAAASGRDLLAGIR